jgi:hypothetical protein
MDMSRQQRGIEPLRLGETQKGRLLGRIVSKVSEVQMWYHFVSAIRSVPFFRGVLSLFLVAHSSAMMNGSGHVCTVG